MCALVCRRPVAPPKNGAHPLFFRRNAGIIPYIFFAFNNIYGKFACFADLFDLSAYSTVYTQEKPLFPERRNHHRLDRMHAIDL